MPEMKIQGGKFSSPVEQPYTVTDPQTGQILLVFDTTGKINTLQDTKAVLLVTETKIHIRDQHDPNKIQIKVIGYDQRVLYAHDGTVDVVADTMTAAGNANHLVQTFTDEHTHSYLADPGVVSA